GRDASRGLESSLIGQLRVEENVSRVELARRMGLAPSTVGQYVDRLIDNGFMREGAKAVQVAAGRPPIVLELSPQAGQCNGIDVEARQLSAILVDFAQQPLDNRTIQLNRSDSAEQVLQKIEEVIADMQQDARRLLGIGLG